MTLIKKDVEPESEFDQAEVLKIETFTNSIKELAVYLGQFHPDRERASEIMTTVSQYDDYILSKAERHDCCGHITCHKRLRYICLAGGKGCSKNPYTRAVVTNIFPVHEPTKVNYSWISKYKLLPYNCKLNDIRYGAEDELRHHKLFGFDIYRDDISIAQDVEGEYFALCIKNKFSEIERFYCVFWNLFLLAIDDDAYNGQLSNVVELARYWSFDEHMLKDCCRAVEYVMSGNKLSEECDFECETVEGARFFLHKKM